MDNTDDDLFLNLLVNSKKVQQAKDFKYVDTAVQNHVAQHLPRSFQILEKHMKSSPIALDHIQQFNNYLDTRIPKLIRKFEKSLNGKFD